MKFRRWAGWMDDYVYRRQPMDWVGECAAYYEAEQRAAEARS
jgi:hypothetical protein